MACLSPMPRSGPGAIAGTDYRVPPFRRLVRRIEGMVGTRIPSQFRDISPLDGKLFGSDAPRGFDRSRERSSGGQSDRRPAPKEQPPPETLRQKDRIGEKLWKAGRPTPGQAS